MKRPIWLLLVALIAAVPIFGGRPTAQSGVTVTFPTLVAAGPDYATDVYGDPWDMNSLTDISPDPDQRRNWSNLAASGGILTGIWSGPEGLTFLYRGHYNVINPGFNGRSFPIDTSRYRRLAFKMRQGNGGGPIVQYSHRPYSDPAGDGLGAVWAFGTAPANTYGIFSVDMGGPFNCNGSSPCATGDPWTSWSVAGLRIDPNFGGPSSAESVSFDWVRLTYSDSDPGRAHQTISWTGSGAATIRVTDAGGTQMVVAALGGGNSYDWNYGFLPPGTYTLSVQNNNGTGSRSFRVNTPPITTVTDPDQTGGEDFSTAVLGNAWDMNDGADVDNAIVADVANNDHLIGESFSGGQFHATNDGVFCSPCSPFPIGDPIVYLLANKFNAANGIINTARYHLLTFRLQVDGAYDLGAGSVARLFWGFTTEPFQSMTTTEPFIVWPGMNTYNVDLAKLQVGNGLGLVGGSPWTGSVTQLRLDPHEFFQQRTFHIDDVKLAAFDEANGTFTVRFTSSDPDGDPVSVRLYYLNQTKTQLLGEITTSPIPASNVGGETQFVWNTANVPPGVYYLFAQATDGIDTRGYFSSGPVNVTNTPPASNPAMSIDGPANGSTVGPSFTVGGWAIDRAAATGTGVSAVHVYATPSGGAQQFLGVASYGIARSDIGAAFGARFTNSGFSLNVGPLAAGSYTITAYAFSTVTNAYSIVRSTQVTVSGALSQPLMAVDAPTPNSSVGQAFTIGGWAIDRGALTGPGTDAIHIYAFPAAGGASRFVGIATRTNRSDIAAAFGSQFLQSGFVLNVPGGTLPPGSYQLVVYARSTVTGTFNDAVSVAMTVGSTNSNPVMFVDQPAAGATLTSGTLTVSGWAIDRGAPSGTGVSQIHVWALPTNGAAGTLLGPAAYGVSRPDVGAAFGSQFTNSGYTLTANVSSLHGSYNIVVFGYSTVTNGFTFARAVPVTR
jgi:hypothetical protein